MRAENGKLATKWSYAVKSAASAVLRGSAALLRPVRALRLAKLSKVYLPRDSKLIIGRLALGSVRPDFRKAEVRQERFASGPQGGPATRDYAWVRAVALLRDRSILGGSI